MTSKIYKFLSSKNFATDIIYSHNQDFCRITEKASNIGEEVLTVIYYELAYRICDIQDICFRFLNLSETMPLHIFKAKCKKAIDNNTPSISYVITELKKHCK